ncbi:MAG: hypothetical protein IKZ44_10745 [Clostridia bacterium]|nr:hypothetical protein [Clostridia bacterium]
MKRYCILALALILALSLFACGTKTGSMSAAEPTAPGEAASVTEAPEEPAEPEAPEEPAETEAPAPKDLEPADIAGVWKCGSEGKKLYARLTFTDGVDLLHYYAEANGTRLEGTVPFTIVNGKEIGFSYDNSDVTAQYDPEADAIELPGVFFNASMTFRRVPEEELSEEEKPIVLSEEATALAGTWRLVSLGVSGSVVAAEDIGQEITLVLYGDGSAEMITGSNREHYRWVYSDGAFTLSAGNVVYDVTVEDVRLKLLEPQSGVDFFFEREN